MLRTRHSPLATRLALALSVVVYAPVGVYEALDAGFIEGVQAVYTPPGGEHDGVGEVGVGRHQHLSVVAAGERAQALDGGFVQVGPVVDDHAAVLESMHL